MIRNTSVVALTALCLASMPLLAAEAPPSDLATSSGLRLERPIHPAAFFDVAGRRSAAFGYESRGIEVWAYPLQVVRDFELAFRLQGYPLEFPGTEVASRIEVRPEATTITYVHAAFTVRQTLFAPIDEPAIVMVVDVRSVLPLTVVGRFRPRLKLMWPAGLMTNNVEWKEKDGVYSLSEESKRFAAIVGGPGMKDVSVMPYQEEPRDSPLRFEIAPRGEGRWTAHVVFAASSRNGDEAKEVFDRVSGDVAAAYSKTVAHYKNVLSDSLSVETPDPRLNEAFAWALVGMDKGIATSALLGTGVLAGFRTAGESERPGFAWFFGRDALWTSLAFVSAGHFESSRTALDFLAKFQRPDGKVPHEISQSSSLIPWFSDYPYPWNSTDASPLYVVAHADYFRASGDKKYLESAWESIVKAFRHAASTDADGNGLIDNTKYGHGWVEGGALYPPHEEIYLQGLWIEACRSMSELAEAMNDRGLASDARAKGDAARTTMEKTYWLPERGFYAFATMRRPEKDREAEPGPFRERRQRRMRVLDSATLVDEDTVLPAAALWFGHAEDARAQSEIDHLGAGTLATDWGQRLLSAESDLYDPLSYHNGSVWPLFSGWASMAAYRYGRPNVGLQALMASALLTRPGSLGYVTELLSGDSLAPFGRSSHHQIWSEAMVVSPLVRGLLGLEVRDGGRTIRLAPQLPAGWGRVRLGNVAAGDERYDVQLDRSDGVLKVSVLPRSSGRSTRPGPRAGVRFELSPAFPLDARVRRAHASGRTLSIRPTTKGDRLFVETSLTLPNEGTTVTFALDEGTDAAVAFPDLVEGEESQGLRILRNRASRDALELVLEGRGGRTYDVVLLSHRAPRADGLANASLATVRPGEHLLRVRFDGPPSGYVRRTLALPLRRP